jgi:hypothetical protein
VECSGQDEQAGCRVEVTGVLGSQSRVVRRKDLIPTGDLDRQATRRRRVEVARRELLPVVTHPSIVP